MVGVEEYKCVLFKRETAYEWRISEWSSDGCSSDLFVEDLEKHMPYYAERHMVKPGITDWAQINYPYGASVEDARQKLEYDLYYAKNYTPFLDILILLQTLRVVLWPEGAR